MQQALKPSPTHEHPSEHKTGHDSSETENEISEDVGRCIEQAAAAHKRHRLHRERRKRRETAEKADRQQELPRTGCELLLLSKQQQHTHDEPHEEAADRVDRQRAKRNCTVVLAMKIPSFVVMLYYTSRMRCKVC